MTAPTLSMMLMNSKTCKQRMISISTHPWRSTRFPHRSILSMAASSNTIQTTRWWHSDLIWWGMRGKRRGGGERCQLLIWVTRKFGHILIRLWFWIARHRSSSNLVWRMTGLTRMNYQVECRSRESNTPPCTTTNASRNAWSSKCNAPSAARRVSKTSCKRTTRHSRNHESCLIWKW